MALSASVAALLATTACFAWLAVASFHLIHGDQTGISNLKAVRITGPQQTVFDWSKEACEPRDIPDAAARAFRDARGEVHLLASHYVSRQAVGPSLNRVRHRCDVIMRSTLNSNPSKFADREWLSTPYTPDGKNVFVLVHDEYHGYQHSGRCSFKSDVRRCWYTAITLAQSDDGGATFHQSRPSPGNLVAAVPYRYLQDQSPYGVFEPSNIVQKDGYYHALVSTLPYRAQEPGSCLIRTKRLDDPGSWRAWNGDKFDVSFADPYLAHVSAEDHLCKPVDPDAIDTMTESLTYNNYLGKYLLVSTAGDYVGRKRRKVWGIYYSLSDDLIHWAHRKLIREAELASTYRCGDAEPIAYPSVLDPQSSSRNFETTGKRAYLYFTRLHYKACQGTLNRDLVRVPIEFSK